MCNNRIKSVVGKWTIDTPAVRKGTGTCYASVRRQEPIVQWLSFVEFWFKGIPRISISFFIKIRPLIFLFEKFYTVYTVYFETLSSLLFGVKAVPIVVHF